MSPAACRDTLHALSLSAPQARHEQVDTEAALEALKRSAQQEQVVDLDAEDEEAVRWGLLLWNAVRGGGQGRRGCWQQQESGLGAEGPQAPNRRGANRGPSLSWRNDAAAVACLAAEPLVRPSRRPSMPRRSAIPRLPGCRQMLLQRAGFVRRLSDSEEEDAPQPGAAGGSGAGRAAAGGRPAGAARVRGAAVAPAAAALWEEELSEASEDTGIDGDAFVLQQFAAAKAAAAGAAAGDGAAASQGQQPESDTGSQGGEEGREEGHQQGGAAAGAAGEQQQQPAQPKPAEKPPPALPKFGVRPVAVVVKRKAEGEAAGARPAKQQPLVDAEDSDGGSPGMGALLAGYGSSGGESQ